MPARNARGAPAQERPSESDTTATAKRQRTSSLSVRRRPPAGQRRRDAVTARVTLIVPGYRRLRWTYLATCPVCLAPHIGKAKELAAVTRVRKMPCGHYVSIVVARTLGRYGVAA